MASGQVIGTPISGERIVIRQTGADTDGRLLAFDLYLPPGGHVPATHAHPVQEERFTIVAGHMRFQIGRRSMRVDPGQTIVVKPGTAHWFGNIGPDTAVARVEIRPALRMAELLERSGAIGASTSLPIKLLPRLALLLLEFERELAVPRIPAALLRLCLQPLAWLARHRSSIQA